MERTTACQTYLPLLWLSPGWPRLVPHLGERRKHYEFWWVVTPFLKGPSGLPSPRMPLAWKPLKMLPIRTSPLDGSTTWNLLTCRKCCWFCHGAATRFQRHAVSSEM